MDAPGETPLRIVYRSYTPDGFWDLEYTEAPDWKQVQSDYEYVWAYGVPEFSTALAAIGDRIYSYRALEVYRLRKASGEGASAPGPSAAFRH